MEQKIKQDGIIHIGQNIRAIRKAQGIRQTELVQMLNLLGISITRDVSIRAASDSEKAELGTPILTYEDIPVLQEILRQLRHSGAKSDPAHMCGVHIHIGLDGHTPKSLRNLANIMAGHESLLISAMRLDGERISSYCRTVDPDFLTRLNRRKPKTMTQLADV